MRTEFEIKRILLVEDDPYDVELTMIAFADNKLANDVMVLNNGQEAIDYLTRQGIFAQRQHENPIVILLDLKMPKVSGLEVLSVIKKTDELKTIPVVILTSSRENKDLDECYRLGANAYVVKPVKFGEFLKTVKNLGIFWAMINEPPVGSSPKK